MMRKTLAYLLSVLLLVAVCQVAGAQQKTGNQTTSVEQIKISVAKLGTGAKARGTITLNSGAKVKGYVAQAGVAISVALNAIKPNCACRACAKSSSKMRMTT